MLRRFTLVSSCGLTLVVGLAFSACGSNNSTGGSSGEGGTDDATGSSGGSSGSGSSSGSASSSGSGSGGSGSSSGSASSSGSGHDSGADSGPPAFDPSVYQHHRNGTRDGLYIDPVFTQTAAATTHITTFMGTVTTKVWAQPLYVEKGPGGNETFIVATEDNHVTAFTATNGTQLWDTPPATIGAAANDRPPGGTVGSGNFGVTGTPYIDITSRTIFFDAMTTPDNSATFHHKVFALSIDTGKVQPNWPVDVDAAVSGFNSGGQNQRGALQFVNGIVYVPYGGYDGDGSTYYGSVIGFPVANPQTPKWWHTTSGKAGIWGPGALPTDGTSIFPITGNGDGGNTWAGSEAVIRLGAGPTFSNNTADYYAPTNWASLDGSDTDLGGASEVLLDMPGAKYPHLVVAGGKDGNLYVLNRDNLGGIGGELLKTRVSGNQVKGAPAAYTTAQGTYVALHLEGGSGSNCPGNPGGNLVVMKITQSATGVAATTAWCSKSAEGNLASPMVTTTDGKANAIVWNASNALYGWNGDTGAVIVDGTKTAMTTGVTKWNTPINAKGRIVVGVDGALYVFTP